MDRTIWVSLKDHDLVVRVEKSYIVNVFSCGAIPAEVIAWISLLDKKKVKK